MAQGLGFSVREKFTECRKDGSEFREEFLGVGVGDREQRKQNKSSPTGGFLTLGVHFFGLYWAFFGKCYQLTHKEGQKVLLVWSPPQITLHV